MADHAALREALVAILRARQAVSPEVAEAFLAVPRHLFLPGHEPEEAYRDEAIVTKRDERGRPISSSSQPAIMATMLGQLGARPGHRVLEIGAGTGYNAALLSHLAERVVSLDIDEDLVERARGHLETAGYPHVRVECADGAGGFAEAAPYDRVIATVGVWELAPAWLEQLAPGGRIVVPLDLRGVQVSAAFERAAGHWRSVSVAPCGFMRMRGSAKGPEETVVLEDNGLTLFVPEARDDVIGDVPGALRKKVAEIETGVSASRLAYSIGLGLWLAVHEPRWCTLSEHGTRVTLVDPPIESRGFRMTAGIAASDGLAVLGAGLTARGYGPGGERLAEELAAHVRAWDEAGQPMTDGLRIDVHRGSAPAGQVVIPKRHSTLVLSYD
ncbi:methyltransferase, FxLD system [Nonomuraea sediminis]|uniref:methyltransferase, FxLD system n=1 Tax=Nonomuraea sediminis TaxID=2835864 RepID=UPI001BDD2A40|nr:methyltransferase, FxLD system [Nonomuraea sediminis]